jgi:hypothetical protein
VQVSLIQRGVQTIWFEQRSENPVEQFKLTPGRWTSIVPKNGARLAKLMARRSANMRGDKLARQAPGDSGGMDARMRSRLGGIGYVDDGRSRAPANGKTTLASDEEKDSDDSHR